VIGSLRYLVNTRPDIVRGYMETPRVSHLAAVKQILQYIAGTLNYGCRYARSRTSEPILLGFSDSDLAGNIDDMKSTSGSIFFVGMNLVTWVSQKQRVVALSSCEAEYNASANAACQGIWLSHPDFGAPRPGREHNLQVCWDQVSHI
jgi:hypothetical protein